MTFRVFRISDTCEDITKSPCDGAVENIYSDHSYCFEPERCNEWYINVNSIPDLIEFIEKNGRIIIQKADTTDDKFCIGKLPLTHEIEIYDHWRE